MNPYMNEEVMWQRLKDLQREAENRRFLGPAPSVAWFARLLVARVWLLAGLAMRRPPRPRAAAPRPRLDHDSDAANRVA